MGKPKVSLPPTPTLERYNYSAFDPANLKLLSPQEAQNTAAQFDRAYYDASDADYAARNPGLVASNAAVRDQVGREATASVEPSGNLPPAVQAELQRAGLGSQLSTFEVTTPGSMGAYGVGRNLGVGALNYFNQQRDRAVAERNASRGQLAAITAAEPQRGFGLTGQDAANLQLGNLGQINQVNVGNNAGVNQAAAANAAGQNQLNQQAYSAQTQAAIANARPSGIGGAIGGLIGGAAGFIPGVGSLIGGPLGGFKLGSGLGSGFG